MTKFRSPRKHPESLGVVAERHGVSKQYVSWLVKSLGWRAAMRKLMERGGRNFYGHVFPKKKKGKAQ